MDKFTKVTGVAAPLMRQNVDTDLIIRIERLVDNVGREGLGALWHGAGPQQQQQG